LIQKEKYYIFYDGDCGFCNFWVQWILKNDQKNQFLFAALQSEFGQKFLKERNLKTTDFNTIYLWKPESFYSIKSDAILTIANALGGIYYMANLAKIFPKSIRDFGYAAIAKNRNRLKPQSCTIPTPEQREKFIE
jgi:predicted DCC family thiol-disulfide oxidoreductase YuxK